MVSHPSEAISLYADLQSPPAPRLDKRPGTCALISVLHAVGDRVEKWTRGCREGI